jgi:hypothetical protein
MRRIIDKRRKPKAPKKTRTEVYLTNLKFLGEEPKFEEGALLTDAQVSQSYNWYNYMSSQEETREFAVEWAEANDKDLLKKIETIPPKLFPATAGKLLRLSSLGYDIGKKRMDFAMKLLNEQSGKKIVDEVEEAEAADKPVQTKTTSTDVRYDSYVGQFEVILDKTEFDLDVYDSLRGNNFPVSCVSRLKGYYSGPLQEYKLALTGTDPDLNEAYARVPKKELKAAVTFLENAIEDMTRYSGTTRKQSAPRKKKTQSVEKKLSTFECQASSTEFKVASSPPENTIGASEVLLFNTKYRTLVLLKGAEGGLDIKGKSFRNVDESRSLQTGTGRRTDKALIEVMAGGKATMNDWMSKKAEPGKKVKVSSDENTIILRIFK